MDKNLYQLLNVNHNASKDEIKKAYRILARKYHPDISKNDSSKKFIEVTNAYEILSDDTERKKYDSQIGHQIFGNVFEQFFNMKSNNNNNNIFDEFFNKKNESSVLNMKNLVHIKGDLLTSDCTVICHQANCFETMGAGIAKQIKEHFPEAYEADKNYVKSLVSEEVYKNLTKNQKADLKFGRCSRTYSKDKSKVIVNLYGQYYYGRDKKYTDEIKLSSAFEEMLSGMIKLEEKGFPIKIGIPYYMGCNLAGGNWDEVSKIINALGEKHNRIIYAYEFGDYRPK